MNIVYCGNFQWPHCTEVHVARTLTSLGHRVTTFQENSTSCGTLFEAARHSDLFLYTRTWGFSDGRDAGNALLTSLHDLGVPTASYHLDLYLGLKRQSTLTNDPFWRTKYVFTPDGGHELEFKRLGINHHYIRPGVFKPECVPGAVTRGFQQDVIFVGSATNYHPEWPYRKTLLRWLQGTYGRRFKYYGEMNSIRNKELNDLYASAKVVVGDSLCLGFKHPYYWSDRVYETVGRGGFLIHPFITGLEEEFEHRKHLVFYQFGDFDGLKREIDHYLDNPSERQLIAKQGQDYVREHCTYTERLTQALKIIEEGECWSNG